MCGKLQGELPKVSAQGDSSPVPAARQQDNRPRVLLALKRGQIPSELNRKENKHVQFQYSAG